ncbi:MAG: type IV pilin protein [Halanaerobiales bacterium]
MLKSQAGFTLIELMAVVVILGILVAIAVPRVMDVREEAVKTTAEADLSTLRTEFELEKIREGSYPSSVDDMEGSLADVWAEIDEKEDFTLVYVESDPYEVRLEKNGEHIILTPSGLSEWQD